MMHGQKNIKVQYVGINRFKHKSNWENNVTRTWPLLQAAGNRMRNKKKTIREESI